MTCDSPRCDNRFFLHGDFCYCSGFLFSAQSTNFPKCISYSKWPLSPPSSSLFTENKTTTNNALTECAHSVRADTDTDTVALRQIQLQIQIPIQIQLQIVRGQNNFEMHLRLADKLLNTCQGGAEKSRESSRGLAKILALLPR